MRNLNPSILVSATKSYFVEQPTKESESKKRAACLILPNDRTKRSRPEWALLRAGPGRASVRWSDWLGRVEMKGMFPDSGGNAWVAVVDDRGRLEVRDLGGIQFSDRLPSSARKHREYLGRFVFDAKKSYRFIPASSDPREPQPPR